MEYGRFIDEGKRYQILTPLTPVSWNNCLYNDSYYTELSQTLQGAGYLVKDYNRNLFLDGYRYFYLVDRQSGEIWNPNYVPLVKTPDSYSCIHGIYMTELKSAQQEVETTIQVMVPPAGTREIWAISLENKDIRPKDISFYSVFGFYDHGVMGGECTYDEASQIIFKYAFPYHTLYEEKEKVEHNKAYTYMFSDIRPDSCEMSRRRFFGSQGEYGIPEGIKKEHLSGIKAEAEDFCGAFSYDFYLKPGQVITFYIELGAAFTKEEVVERKKRFTGEQIRAEFHETEDFWDAQFDGFYMETPDENLNAFGNYWLKKQITLLTRQNRGSSYCPVRNQLQDAMGYAMIRPEDAQKYIFAIMKQQRQNGFIQQWHDTTGAPPRGLCLLKHTDGPVWLVICAETLIRQTGRREMFNQQVPYADGGSGTVLEHMKRALLYLAGQTGAHGMCLMGDGDWNDPINGVGRMGKGESVWLSMAFVYAAKLLVPYLREADPESCLQIYRAAEKMTDAVNAHAWCDKWYAAAIHDDGQLIGDTQDRLFLNTQSWAIIAGVADDYQKKVLSDTLKRLATPFGPLILYPPFEGWDARWGRISVKKAGTTENGSVYCHASMFLALAQALCNDGDGLYETLWRTLPTNPENAPEKNLQVPLYLANYYYGLQESPNFGRSSQHYGTGTVAWMLMLLIEEVFGIRATVDGIMVQPCLPEAWHEVKCVRRYQNAIYHITIFRGKSQCIYVDGELFEKEILPYEDNRAYRVEINIL